MGQNVLEGKMCRTSPMKSKVRTDANQHQQRQVRGDTPGILQPFADVQSHNVQDHCHRKQCH
jgi:hypothetical protein